MEIKKVSLKDAELTLDKFAEFLGNIHYSNYFFTNTKRFVLENPSLDIKLTDNTALNTSRDQNDNKNLNNDLVSIFKFDLDLTALYNFYQSVYGQMGSQCYTMEEFTSVLKVLNSLMQNFNEDLLKINIDTIWDENISVFLLDESENLNNFKESCQKVCNMTLSRNEISSDQGGDEKMRMRYRNVIYLFHLFTICGKMSYSKLRMDNFMINLHLYSKLYMSHLNYALLVHLEMILLFHMVSKMEDNQQSIDSLSLFQKKKPKSSDSVAIKKRVSGSNIETQSESLNKANSFVNSILVPCLYFIDSITSKDMEEEIVKVVIVTNYFKYYMYNYFSSTNYKKTITINFRVINPEFIFNTLFYYEFASNSYSRNVKLTSNQLMKINDLTFLNNANLFKINEMTLIVKNYTLLYEITNIFKDYQSLILKSRNFSLKDNSIEGGKFVEIERFINELEILEGIILLVYNLTKMKKKQGGEFYFSFKMNFFRLQSSKGINEKLNCLSLIFNHSNLPEEEIVGYVSILANFNKLYQKFRSIFKNLQKFKKYQIGVSLYKDKDVQQSHELNFYLNILALSLQNLCDEEGFKNIKLFETNTKVSPRYTIFMANIIKEKDKRTAFARYLKKLQNVSLSFFGRYTEQLLNYFKEVVIHDNIENHLEFSPDKLLRRFKHNKIIFINNGSDSISIIVYIHGNESCKLFYHKIMEFLKALKLDPAITALISEIVVVLHKSFLEHEILQLNSEANSTKILFQDIHKLYVINNNADGCSYDIDILDTRVCVINYIPIAKSITNKHINHIPSNVFITNFFISFLRIFKDCAKLLLYLIQKKGKYIEHCTYVFKSNEKSKLKFVDFVNGNCCIKTIRMLPTKSAATSTLALSCPSNVFNNESALKSSYSYPRFSLVTFNRTMKYNFTTEKLLEIFIEHFSNIIEEVENMNDSLEDADERNQLELPMAENSLIREAILRKLHLHFFHGNYSSFIPIAFFSKAFFTYTRMFYNYFDGISNGEIFEKFLILPLNCEDISITNFLNDFRGETSNWSSEYFPILSHRLTVFNTDLRPYSNDVKKDEIMKDVLYRGKCFTHSKVEFALEQIEAQTKVNDVVNQFQITQNFYQLRFCMQSKKSMLRRLAMCREREMCVMLARFMGIRIHIEVGKLKMNLINVFVQEIEKKKEDVNNQKMQKKLQKLNEMEVTSNPTEMKKSKRCLVF